MYLTVRSVTRSTLCPMSNLTRTYEVGAVSKEAACAVAIFQGAEELFFSPNQMRVIEVKVLEVGEESTLYKIEVAGPA
jgi:hypothetical protein